LTLDRPFGMAFAFFMSRMFGTKSVLNQFRIFKSPDFYFVFKIRFLWWANEDESLFYSYFTTIALFSDIYGGKW
jgi:hypothetical protein